MFQSRRVFIRLDDHSKLIFDEAEGMDLADEFASGLAHDLHTWRIENATVTPHPSAEVFDFGDLGIPGRVEATFSGEVHSKSNLSQ